MSINLLAIFVTALLSFALGALWYGPLFGKKWQRYMGFSPEKIASMQAKPMARQMILQFISVLIMTLVLLTFILILQASTYIDGLIIGFWIWLGFFATTQLNPVLWEGKSWKLYLLNISYHLVQLLLMGVLLTVWQ